jgi:predicted acyltransferase
MPNVWRIPGVLQRIGIVFILTGITFIKLNKANIVKLCIVLLAGYWVIITLKFDSLFNLDLSNGYSNIGAWLDKTILTENHLWKWSRKEGWDPESLLGSIPATITCLFGAIAGLYIKLEKPLLEKISTLFIVGSVLTVLGLFWNLSFPINKNLWTSSYVVYTGGIAIMCTAFCIWLIDYKQYTKISKPFVKVGANALTAYILSEMVSALLDTIVIQGVSIKGHISQGIFSGFSDEKFKDVGITHPDFSLAQLSSHLYAFLWIIPFYILLSWMYKKKIFIKV